MPMYDPSELYTDPILTEFSVGYESPLFYGLRMLPEAPVNTASGIYRVWDRSKRVYFLSRREPGTVANEVRGGRWSTDTFKTVQHALQAAVADEEEQQLNSLGGYADSTFSGDFDIDPHEDAAALVFDSLQLEHELTVATLLRNTATYPAGHTVTLLAADQWDNYAGATSNPIDVIRAAILKIESKIGRKPNRLLMSTFGQNWLENHPDVVARFSNFSLTDPEAFRKLVGFDGELVLVQDDWYNANDILESTESLTAIWGKDVILAYVNPQLTLRDLSFGKTFAQIYPDGSTRPTDRWREEGRKSDLVRTHWKWDVKITSSIAGYLIKDAFGSTAW
jgi:hypothetical protein